MSNLYVVEQSFERLSTLEAGEYELCDFVQCDFSNLDFSEYKFVECTFRECNLSLLKLEKTAVRNCQFYQCKMLGLRFDACNPFGLSFRFENCQLNHSSFFNVVVKKTYFKQCQLQEVDFTDADLSGAIFEECNLSLAHFERTNLEKADLRTARDFIIDPEQNRLKKAKFSMQGLPGLLSKYGLEIEY